MKKGKERRERKQKEGEKWRVQKKGFREQN